MSARRLSGVLLDGRDLVDVARCVRSVLEQARRVDGIYPSPRLAALEAVLSSEAAAVLSRPRHDDVAEGVTLPSWDAGSWLTAREAAATMGVSVRTVQRRATALGARRVGRRWLIDPVAVADLGSDAA